MHKLHIRAWASGVAVRQERAMREASESRTATDTDSYAFFFPPTANERTTEAKITSHEIFEILDGNYGTLFIYFRLWVGL